MLTGLLVLGASALAGVLWDRVGEWAPFALGSTCALLAAVLLLFARAPQQGTPAAAR